MRDRIAVTLAALLALAAPAASDEADRDPDGELVRKHFEEARRLDAAGRFAEACAEYEKAQGIRPLAAFHYYLGGCRERVGDLAAAEREYVQYLVERPGAHDKAAVLARIDELGRRRHEARGAAVAALAGSSEGAQPGHERATPSLAWSPESPSTGPERPLKPADAIASQPARRHRFAAPIAVGAVALALGAAGGALLGSVQSTFSDLKSQCGHDCAPATVDGLQARADVGYALLAGAGAAALVDVGLFIWAARRPRAHPPIAVLPVGRSLVASGHF